MNERELSQKEQEAIRQMREMSRRSQASQISGRIPPSPDFVRLRNDNNSNDSTGLKIENQPPQENTNAESKGVSKNTSSNNGIGFSFLDSVFKDGDSTLIIGLLLLLMSEKSDKILLFALVYILL